ncbi:unnamed protein product [Haemonchus placei]|uniref:BRCT domain-containing protein n=1 Tax=Haemonchus placei TaxID=6290 RepID=A0A158QK25_HAEPC|nr:unnamed protein product [Haemonchus placei]
MKRGKRAGRGRRGGLDDSFGGDGGLAFDKRNRAGRDRGGYHGSRGGGTDSRDCWRGSWRDVGRGNQQGWQGQKRSGGFSGFSTGSFGVMGDVDIINCSSNSPENVTAEIPIANMEDFSCGTVCEKVKKIGCSITHDGELPDFSKNKEIAFTSNPLQDKGASCEVFESSKLVEHHQNRTINVHKETVIRLRKNIEVNKSESGECHREHKNDAVTANINGLDDFIRHSTHPKRRVRSLSQTLMNGFGGGSLKEERRSSAKYYSIRATEEECRQFVGDEEGQIRSIHNDGNFNNHRLSKLSIHTNNDEFFYVGGHPPSDGRTSLRSRGTISRQVDSHYMTASEQIRSPEVGGEVLEAMISSRSELLSNEDKNTHSEASGITTFVTPMSTYESQEAIKLTSSENNFNQDEQLTEMPYERNAEARIPRQLFTNSRQTIDDQSTTVHKFSSEASIDRANGHHPKDMRKSTQNVADEVESPSAQKYSSEISLHAARNHPLTASRQSMPLSMSNVADGDEPATAQLNSSEVSLHAGDKHYPLSVIRQTVRQSTQNAADDVEPATAQIYSSEASLHAAESHHPLTASRKSMRISTSNVADDVELPTTQVYSSQATLHAAECHHPLTASRQSMRTSTQNVGDDVEPATAQVYSSQASLHAAESYHPLTASRQSMWISTYNAADDVELPTAQVYTSQASLHAAECHHPLTSSRQNMRISTSNVADDVELPTAQVYSSQASLHAAECHHPLTSSRQSMRISTSNVADDVELPTAQVYSSQASLPAAECHHPLTASRQSMRISTSNVADDVELPTAQVYSSQASLHAAESHHPLNASRQSMRTSTQNVGDDVELATARMYSSQDRLHATECHHPLTSSRQSMRISSSIVAGDVERPTAQLYSSQASLHAAVSHPPLTASRQSMEVYNRDDSEMFQSNLGREVIIPVAQSNLGREVIIEGSNTDPPKLSDRCSLQTLPVMCSRSRGSSQSSVHGFETSSGGLWYHFSNPERIQNSSSSNAKAGHMGVGTSTKTRVQVTSQASSNKTSQRSRSSSRTRQNEVHFSSIPQLFSHPDDRFVVDSSGEPFRPTAEHERTPKVVNVGSRNLVANCESRSSLPEFHQATVAMDSQLLTVPVQSGTESNVESDMDLPSQAPSLKSIDINPPPDVPPALVVTDALTPKRAPIAIEDQDGHNSPAGLNRTIFSRPAFRRRRFKEVLLRTALYGCV